MSLDPKNYNPALRLGAIIPSANQTIFATGPNGATGVTGATGVQGPTGPSGPSA